MTLQQMMSMRGRTVLLTGATGWIGSIVADTLAELGADLILVDRPGSNFELLSSKLVEKWGASTLSIACDLESDDDRNKLIEKVKLSGARIGCLINNAAFVDASGLRDWVGLFEEQSVDVWRRALEVNLTAAFHLSQSFVAELRESKGGLNSYHKCITSTS